MPTTTRRASAHFRRTATSDAPAQRQPRPAPRRTSTRQAFIAAHLADRI